MIKSTIIFLKVYRVIFLYLYIEREKEPCQSQSFNESYTCDTKTVDNIISKQDSALTFVGPDNYIFHEDKYPNNSVKSIVCQLTFFKLPFARNQMYFGIRKGLFRQKKQINEGLIRLRETGLLQKLNQKYRPRKPDCFGETDQDVFKSVGIFEVIDAYFVLGVGYVVAIFIIWVEIVMENFRRNRFI